MSEPKKREHPTEQDIQKMAGSFPFDDFYNYLRSPWRIIWTNILAGLCRSIGMIIGLTIFVSIIIWLLNQFVDFPVIGQYFGDLKNSMENIANISNKFK